MQKRLLVAVAAASSVFGLSQPAAATRWLVAGTGFVGASTTPGAQTALPGLPLQFQTIGFGMIVNDGAGGADLPPPFGIGGLTAYAGAVESFVLFAGPYGIQAGASSPKSLFVYNDVPGASPMAPARLDQFTYNAGVDFSAGFKPHIELDPAAGPDLFVSNLVFGRTQSGSVDALPTMLTSTAIPDLPSVWRPDVQMLFLFDIRQGVPASSAAMRQLPVARFTVTNLNFGIVALPVPGPVPEPATWALFIAGFGLVGSSLRRRRTLHA